MTFGEYNLDKAVKYHYDSFPPKQLQYDRFMQPLLKATDSLARYDQMLKGMHNSELLLAPLRNQEAVISSRMEGTISTMDEILKYEADHSEEDSTNSWPVRSEVVETLLYRRALNRAQDSLNAGYDLSVSFIKTLHQQLLSYGRGAKKSPGQLKRSQNYLADRGKQEIHFVPISPEHLQEGLDSLFQYIHDSEDVSLIKTALMHLEFEALHPFEDGNGRIGRMLITLLLWRFDLISEPHFYISAYLEKNKEAYIQTMREVSKNGSWEEWCSFFFTALDEQAVRNLEIAENIQELYENMKVRFTDLLSPKWSINALDYIFTNPIFRNSSFTQKSGIPVSTATRFTKKLSKENLLKTVEEASGRRAALYSFEPLMELVRV